MENETKNSDKEMFRSRYSIVLLIIIFIPFVSITEDFIKHPSLIAAFPFVILFFILAIFFSIRYEILSDKLIFKYFFLFKKELDISLIESVERSYMPLSSNAASLKRLYGKMKKGKYHSYFLISPNKEERFLERLKEINPKIKIKVSNKKGFYRFWDWDI